MMYLVIKAAISGIIVAAVTEIARRSPGVGARSVSRPLIMLIPLFLERDVPFYSAPTLIGGRSGGGRSGSKL